MQTVHMKTVKSIILADFKKTLDIVQMPYCPYSLFHFLQLLFILKWSFC